MPRKKKPVKLFTIDTETISRKNRDTSGRY